MISLVEKVSNEQPSAAAPAGARTQAPPVARREAVKREASRIMAIAGRHWLFLLLVATGGALRGVTFFAYRPAIFGVADSYWYLDKAADLEPATVRPIGYAAFLRLLPLDDHLAVAPFVQHVLGLGVALVMYAVLLRLGVRRWLGALATAPLLLDAYQLNIEQQILAETVFQALLAAGCALLLWRRPLDPASAGAAGLLFAASALIRPIGALVVVPAALTVLFLRARPSRAVTLVALVAAFALPLAAYATWFHSVHGVYALTGFSGRFLYGRVAEFADCSKFAVPQYGSVLCPTQPPGERPSANYFVWMKQSPVRRVEPPPGMTRDEVAGDFARRAILHQPLAYAEAVGADFLSGFSPTKISRPGELRVAPWQFQPTFPVFFDGTPCSETRPTSETMRAGCIERRQRTLETIRAYGGSAGYADPKLTSFLRTYQRFGYTAGPVLAVCFILGALAALGVGRARRSGLRSAAFLFLGLALVVWPGALAVSNFSWRYQLPLLVLLPTAAALGIQAFTRKRADDEQPSAGPRSARTTGWHRRRPNRTEKGEVTAQMQQ